MLFKKLLGGKVLSGKAASINNFRRLAPEYGLIHFATHAKSGDDHTHQAYLVLSETTTGSEKIFAPDIREWMFSPAMVVLSACETGVSGREPGKQSVSLAFAFADAGAKSVVASLWSANDWSSAKIMKLFYKNLKSGLSKDEALRQAKLSFLDQQNGLIDTHPHYWATFVAIGDMEAIKARTVVCWHWFVSGFIAGLGFIFYRQRKVIFPFIFNTNS